MDRNTPVQRIARPDLKAVVGGMKNFAHKGKKDLEVRRLVEIICKDLHQGDYASECLALYYWVCANVRYMRDIKDVEFVKEPSMLLATRAGDCDDIATLLAAMLMANGNRCSFVLACFTTPPVPSHVYVQVHTPAGDVPLDPVANIETEKMLKKMTRAIVVPL